MAKTTSQKKIRSPFPNQKHQHSKKKKLQIGEFGSLRDVHLLKNRWLLRPVEPYNQQSSDVFGWGMEHSKTEELPM